MHDRAQPPNMIFRLRAPKGTKIPFSHESCIERTTVSDAGEVYLLIYCGAGWVDGHGISSIKFGDLRACAFVKLGLWGEELFNS